MIAEALKRIADLQQEAADAQAHEV